MKELERELELGIDIEYELMEAGLLLTVVVTLTLLLEWILYSVV